jgi:para-aminobenzoate synthetase component 1
MRLTPLPYRTDSAALFNAIADLDWPVFLDSGPAQARRGRYDILAAQPYLTLVSRGAHTEITHHGQRQRSPEDPLALLRKHLAIAPDTGPLPFMGGAIGYFGYDLARRLTPLGARPGPPSELPEMAVGLYDWAVVIDHEQDQAWLVGAGRDPATTTQWDALVARFTQLTAPRVQAPFRVGPLQTHFSEQHYHQAFQRVQAYIADGDCYQVNLAQRFSAPRSGDPWNAYRSLRELNPAPHGAYLDLADVQILSSSPERFLSVRAGRAETRPIKGTRPRAPTASADAAQIAALSASAKDHAENLMIVDLLRNDLGQVCTPGTITVPQLFGIESYASVHHLVSTITGQLAAGHDALDLLRAAFPGGSITGAPKLRAMQIIDELEPHTRDIYCGAIGWLGFNGDMDTNIAIRTLVCTPGQLHFWAGGGLVADSDADAEYRECLDKAAPMLRLLRACGSDWPPVD